MSSPRPKVNPPLCGICMSSVDVKQELDGGWHCRKQRCFRQRTYKPIMVTEIEKDEPVSPGLFNRLWAFLTRDPAEDRRPKHPRPDFLSSYLRSPKNTGAPRPKPPQPAPIQINVAGFIGNEAELASQLPEVIKQASGSVDELDSTGCIGDKTFVPRPPKVPSVEDRLRSRIEGESIETDLRGGLRQNGEGAENALLTTAEEKDHDQLPTEKSWRKRETEKAPATSSAWWTVIKWTIGAGASIGLGWLIEWAVILNR